DADAALLQLNSGTLDIYQYLSVDQMASLDPSVGVAIGSLNYVQGMFLNNGEAPFDNMAVRQAVYYAVDRDLINQMLFDGTSHILGTHMIPAATTYYNAATETTYTRDVEKAKQILADAGVTNLSFEITVPENYPLHMSTAEIIVESLAEAGITATIKGVDWDTWLSDVYMGRKYQATVVAVDGTLAPNSWFSKFISTASNNFINFNNAEYDEVYGKAMSAIDQNEKITCYTRLQEILANDASSIYLEDPSNIVAVNANLEGYVFYPVSAQDMSVVKYK
ncbi:MAG: ABC transporter substrate-binding protein, partial [Parasporobacterium sp.]|nr:ABC transporter substrate-binding protein [Parasporobacterium sp.]